MDSGAVAGEYASHLTQADIRLLVSAAGGARGADPGPQARSAAEGDEDHAGASAHLGGREGGAGDRGSAGAPDPETLLALLGDLRVFQAVLGREAAAGPPAPVSPFLVFAVAVHRAAEELAGVDHVPERTGPRQRVPLFDAPDLRDFLGSPARRLFLAELLASFTKIASGRYQVSSGGRTRTRRYSELDPVRLAGLLDAVPDSQRPGVYRRLGDVSLFLTGVFPDYAAGRALGLVSAARLLRAARLPPADHQRLTDAPALELLEQLGARWYRAAWDLAQVRTARLEIVAEVAGRFRQARRVLNHVADRYLFVQDTPWFPRPDW